jgi:hypothetical protein
MDITQAIQMPTEIPNEVPNEIPNEGNEEIKSMQEESHMCNDCMGKAYEMLKSTNPSFSSPSQYRDWDRKKFDSAIAELESIDSDVIGNTPDAHSLAHAIELDMVDIATGDINIKDQLRRAKKYFQDLDQRLSPSRYGVDGGLTIEDINRLSDEQDPDSVGPLINEMLQEEISDPEADSFDIKRLSPVVDELEKQLNWQDLPIGVTDHLEKAIEIAKRSDQDEFVCPKCDYKTNIKEEYEDHKITHDDYYMKQNESISHLQETHHMCSGCNQTFLKEFDISNSSDRLGQNVVKGSGHFFDVLTHGSRNKHLADQKRTRPRQVLGTNCNECGIHFEGNALRSAEWETNHHEETGHSTFTVFMIDNKSGESIEDGNWEWQLVNNEWIPIGRKKNLQSQVKRQNVFLDDITGAD